MINAKALELLTRADDAVAFTAERMDLFAAWAFEACPEMAQSPQRPNFLRWAMVGAMDALIGGIPYDLTEPEILRSWKARDRLFGEVDLARGAIRQAVLDALEIRLPGAGALFELCTRQTKENYTFRLSRKGKVVQRGDMEPAVLRQAKWVLSQLVSGHPLTACKSVVRRLALCHQNEIHRFWEATGQPQRGDLDFTVHGPGWRHVGAPADSSVILDEPSRQSILAVPHLRSIVLRDPNDRSEGGFGQEHLRRQAHRFWWVYYNNDVVQRYIFWSGLVMAIEKGTGLIYFDGQAAGD
jgi:hypothetical protein